MGFEQKLQNIHNRFDSPQPQFYIKIPIQFHLMEAFAMILSYNNLAVINDAVNVSVIKNFGIKGSWWLHCSALEPEARRFSTHLPYKCTYLTRIQWASSVHLWHKKRPTTRVYLWQIKNTENFNLEILTITRTFI